MSTLETNAIGKYSGNNVSIDDALNLKSYDTAGRDALTSVAGDTIYNTTTAKVEYYDGSAWVETGSSTFDIDFLVIAGGGSGGKQFGGGGGAGGYRNSYNNETSGRGASSENASTVSKGVNILIQVGAGAAGNTESKGGDSIFNTILSKGGGSSVVSRDGGCGAGGAASSIGGTAGLGTTAQGYDGGSGLNTNGATAGGGGAGVAGGDNVNSGNGVAGNGGNGLSSSITGSAVTRGGGGGGSCATNATGPGTGGTGGGGNGGKSSDGTAGSVNTGGGGGAKYSNTNSMAGGSGVVILRWATADATIGATRTGLTDGDVQTDGTDSYIVFTGGNGNITFS